MFYFLLVLQVYGTIFHSFDPNLDPGDIYWPSAWVSSPVSLSSNHASSTGITMTINLESQVDIPSGSYYSVEIQGFFSVLTGSTTSDMPANTPSSFTITNITLPTISGSYGPITIIFQQAARGKIIASASSFGFVGLVRHLPISIPSLSVTYATGASTLIQSSTSVHISFPLSAPLNPYDFFMLYMPSTYTLTTPVAPVWNHSTTGYGLFVNTGYDHNILDQTITVYGLQKSITEDITVGFTLSGLTNPAFVTTDPSTWTVKVFRFGTSTVLQQCTGTGPLTGTTAGNVTVTSWTPSNGYITASQIVAGVTTYMSLVFSCQHDVPALGTISVIFSGGISFATGYINWEATQKISGLSTKYALAAPTSLFTNPPTITGQVLVITIGNAPLPAKTLITLYTLAIFSLTSAEISSIITEDSNKNTIDSSTSLYSITYPASSAVQVIGAEPSIYFTPSTTLYGINTCGPVTYGGGLNIDFSLDIAFAAGQTITVNLPIVNQASSADSSIGFGTVIWGEYITVPVNSAATAYTSVSTLKTAPVVSANSVLVMLDIAYAANNYVSVLVGTGGSPGTLSAIYMPNFPSSLYSRHEATLQYTVVGTDVLRLFSKPFYFSPAYVSPLLQPFCRDTGIPGMLAKMTITPAYAYTPGNGYTTFIDFAIVSTDTNITAGLGSGLSSGSTYPASDLPAGAKLTIAYTYAEISTYTSHLILSLPSLSPSLISFYFPFPALTASKPPSTTASIISKYSDGTKYYLTNSIPASSAFQTPADATVTSMGDSTPLKTQTNAGNLTLAYSSPPSILATSNIGIAFDMGFRVSSPILTVGSSLNLVTFSSPSAIFPYLVLHAFSAVASTPSNWTLYGVITSWTDGSLYLYNYAVHNTASQWATTATACDLHGKYGFSLSAPQLLYLPNSYFPTQVRGLGPTSSTTNLTIAFAVPGPIYGLPSTSIVVALGANFKASASSAWKIKAESYEQSGTGFILNSFTASGITSDIAVNGVLTISVTDVPVPATIYSNSTLSYAFASVSVRYGTRIVYEWLPGVNTTTTVLPSISSNSSEAIAVNTFPNTAGATGVYLQIVFSASYDLPAGTIIVISGNSFLPDDSVVSNSWCNYGFTSASILTSSLILTLKSTVPANSAIEVRKDMALDIPVSAEGSDFQINAIYGPVSIIISSIKPVYYAAPSASVTYAELTISLSNKGVLSTHSFVFKLSNDTTDDFQYCFDVDGAYDAHFGDWITFDEAPMIYYVWAYSSLVPDNVMCTVDHWIINCGSVGVVSAGKKIDFSFTAWNPHSDRVSWNLYVIKICYRDYSAVASYYSITANFTDIPKVNVDLYYVTHDLGPADTYNFTFQALISESYSKGGTIFIEFPQEIELSIYNNEYLACSGINMHAPASQFVASTCKVWRNIVQFPVTVNVAFTNNYWTFFTLNDIRVPQSGLVRTTGYDATSLAVFQVYDFWTNTFCMYTTTSLNSRAYSSMSVRNLGAAYTGFMKPDWFTISINNGQTIYLAPGTYSTSIPVSVDSNSLDSNDTITLSPSFNNILKLEYASLTINTGSPKVYFSVGTPIETPEGFYYISWSLDEAALQIFRAPGNTLVQVYSTGQISINIHSIYNVPPFRTSLPITLTIENGIIPYSDVSVLFSCNETGVYFIPDKLTFTSVVTAGAFVIGYNKSISVSTEVQFCYYLIGTDVDAFTISNPGFFRLVNMDSVVPIINSMIITAQSQNTATISIDINTPSVVTWIFGSTYMFLIYPELYTYDFLHSLAYPVVGAGTTIQTAIRDQINSYNSALESVNPASVGWEYYSMELMMVAETSYFIGQSFLPEGNSTLYSFNSLMPSVQYTLAAYSDNYSGFSSAFAKTTAVTPAIAKSCAVNTTFSSSITVSDIDLINAAIAETLSIFTGRVINYTGITNVGLSYSLSSLILGDVKSSITPLSLGNLLSAMQGVLLANIRANGLDVTSVSTTASEITQTYSPSPVFSSVKLIPGIDGLLLHFTSAVNGVICCVIVYRSNDTIALAAYDLFLELQRSRTNPPLNWCWNLLIGGLYAQYYNFTAAGNYNYGNYTLTCSSCNEYPVWPVCLNSNGLVSYEFTWTGMDKAAAAAITLWLLVNIL